MDKCERNIRYADKSYFRQYMKLNKYGLTKENNGVTYPKKKKNKLFLELDYEAKEW